LAELPICFAIRGQLVEMPLSFLIDEKELVNVRDNPPTYRFHI
jgi:hypothetical protein